MTIELDLLVATALLALLLPFGYTVPRMRRAGIRWGLGNRETNPETPPWVARAERAHRNFVENLAPFAIIVIVAHLAGVSNAWTVAGAAMFFGSRVLHPLAYILGLVGVRTVIFYVGAAGELLIVSQLFR